MKLQLNWLIIQIFPYTTLLRVVITEFDKWKFMTLVLFNKIFPVLHFRDLKINLRVPALDELIVFCFREPGCCSDYSTWLTLWPWKAITIKLFSLYLPFCYKRRP